mgnify:CR=1 FL=1
MRASVLCSIVLSALVLAGCAAKGPPRVVKEEPPRLMFVGVDRIPNDIRSVPLFVSFEGSSSMTNYLREAFSKRGFLITNEKADARYSIQVNGHFTSKGKINVPPTALGPIFDSADAAVAARDYRTKTTGQALTTTAAFVQSAEMFGTGYMNIMGHSILDAISDATGISGRFNQLVAGDPRGVCFTNCEDWDFSRQHARVEAYLFEGDAQLARFGRAAETYQPTFVPQHLIIMALDGTVNAVLEGAKP